MKRLVYRCFQDRCLAEVAEHAGQDHLRGWRCRALGRDQMKVDRSGLKSVSVAMKSRLIGQSARGIVLGTLLGSASALVMVFLVGISSPVLEKVTVYALVLVGLFFGGWLGGLLGLVQRNPLLMRFDSHLDQDAFLLFVDVADVDERLARKVLAMCDMEPVATYTRRWFSWQGLPDQVAKTQ